MAASIAVSFFAFIVLIMLSLTAGFWLGEIWGANAKAFLVLSGFYLLLTLMLYYFKRPFITHPVLHLMLDAFFDREKEG